MGVYKIGPAQVVFKGTNLGDTNGGVTVRTIKSHQEFTVDQRGATPVEEIESGMDAGASFAIAEITPEVRATIFGEVVETGSGGEKRVVVSDRTGCSRLDDAGLLTIIPIVCGVPTTDEQEWIQMPLASPKPEVEETLSPDQMRTLPVNFRAFPEADGRVVYFGSIDGSGGF